VPRVELVERRAELGGIEVHWRESSERQPILYLHGVPTASWDWQPFLERTGGVAPDLPGFGQSGKPSDFDYSIAGYDRFVEIFADAAGLDRFSLVVHDWGAVGLAFAQRFPDRIERLVMFSTVPFVPGYRWHRVARIWRTPLVGELAMGASTKWAFRRALPDPLVDNIWSDFDHGTQRAILKLYRSAPERVLAEAGARLGELRAPALLLWSTRDPYIPAKFGQAHADVLGGPAELELVDAGHWPWLDRPELVERVARFLG
jgi:pimeloyl-ACP methyl ester carboxylesterase